MSGSNRILIVDDEAGLRTSLAANLELEGYVVAEAADGLQAIDMVRETPFDLVISDVRMPGMNGVQVFREIRRIRPELPVVLMTAFALEGLLSEALGEGVYALVHKPFAVDDLIALTARALADPAVLVVDDREDHAATIVASLQAVGLRATAVHDGASAVQLVIAQKVDVCVLDLVMPGMDGVKTYEEIRRIDPSISVIAISGHAVPRMMHALMSLGGYACLRKPFDMPELTRAIARARSDTRR